MLRLLRSGNDGALLQARAALERAYEEDQKISSIPALSCGEYFQGVSCGVVSPLLWTLMVKRC